MKKSSELTVYCEFMNNPLGMDIAAPCFSWVLNAEILPSVQTAYQIVVTKTANNETDEKVIVWDSGIVDSAETLNIPYEGKPLESAQAYFYQITVETDAGEKIQSERGSLITGLMNSDEWQGMWVGGPSVEQNTFWYRKDFTAKAPIKKAIAFLASPNYVLLTVNGDKPSDTVLNNAWSECSKTILYSTFDVTKLVIEGNNAVGIITGNGWHNLRMSEDGVGWGESIFSFQMLLRYQNGTSEWVCSNLDGWMYSNDGPLLYNSIYNGETYDARKEIPGWDKVGYLENADADSWMPVTEHEPPGGKMRAQFLEPIRVVKTVESVAIHPIGDGSYGIDFGQNFAGWVRLKFSGTTGTKIIMKFAELENADHSINPVSIRKAKATDTYIAKGEGEEVYEPIFTYHGFRYVQVFGLEKPPTKDMFTGCIVRSDVDVIGSFECDNGLLNKLYSNIMWTEGSNLHGLPTDCPQRDERLGWLNDMTVRNECALYNYRLPQLYRKWLGNIRDTQGENTGAVTDTAPFRRYGLRPADPVSVSFLLLPWNTYLHYGDVRILEENYEANKRWVQYLKTNSDNYIVRYTQMGDWAAPIGGTDLSSYGAGAISMITPRILIGTAYFQYHCRILAKIAAVLGKEDDAAFYDKEADCIREALMKKYFNPTTKQFAKNSQASNTLPLYLGMVNEADQEQVLNNIVEDIAQNDKHLTTGNLCTRYVIEVLFLHGMEDLAYDLLTQTSYPSWGYMIENNATTIWERWEYVTEGPLCGMASHNHPMNGAVGVCFHKYLAGIQVDESSPAFKNIIIKPIIPSQMSYVAATLNTMRGQIKSSWKKEKGNFTQEVTIPFNCTGQVFVPLLNSDSNQIILTVGGEIVFKNNAFTTTAYSGEVINDKYLLINVPSGVHNIRYIVNG